MNPITDLINDIEKVSAVDDPDGKLIDAVIDQFCEEHYGDMPQKEELTSAALKIGIHSAMEDGLTRSEIVAAISQTGSIIHPEEMPDGTVVVVSEDAYTQAMEIAGRESEHLHDGLARFIDDVDGTGRVIGVGAEAEPARRDWETEPVPEAIPTDNTGMKI